MEVEFFITFSLFNTNFGYFLCDNLILFLFLFCNKIMWDSSLHVLCYYYCFFVSRSGFGTKLALVFILVKKSWSFGCFHAHDNLNKLSLYSFFLLLYYYYPIVLKSCLHQWKKSLLSLGILNRKIKHFVNLLFTCKPINFQPLWDVFL
jgi:hypothetical protein